MMTADEAYKQATSVSSNKHKAQLTEIETIIQKSIDNGETKGYYFNTINKVVQDFLVSLGYKITSTSGRNETTTTISWDMEES